MGYFPPFQQLIGQQLVWLKDSISKCFPHHTLSNMFSNRIFETHYVQILSCFGFEVDVWFTIRLTFLAFQLSSPSFSTMLWTWLGLPHPLIIGIFWCVCTHPIDAIGVHLLCYAHDNEMLTSTWDENNHTHFLQPHFTPLVDELTLCSPKMEFTC